MPILAIWPWIVGLLGSVVSSAATWFIGRMAIDRAFHYALVTGFLVAVTGMFLTLTLATKALIISARVGMPASLGAATFFLPPSLPLIISTIVTIRVGVSVYRWSVSVLSAYLPHKGDHRMMGI